MNTSGSIKGFPEFLPGEGLLPEFRAQLLRRVFGRHHPKPTDFGFTISFRPSAHGGAIVFRSDALPSVCDAITTMIPIGIPLGMETAPGARDRVGGAGRGEGNKIGPRISIGA